MRYLVLGSGGMAGHVISIYLSERGEDVVGVARRQLDFCESIILDVTDFAQLIKTIHKIKPDIIINCIGILNQDAENNPDKAILLNSYFPHFLSKITQKTETRIIQISTDCVFSGEAGGYKEDSVPDEQSYYGRSKALGELNDGKNLTFRTSIIGPDINRNGIGLLNWYIKQEGTIWGYQKAIWSGVTTMVLADAIFKASMAGVTGLYHLVNNKVITKCEILKLTRNYINKNIKIEEIDGEVYDKSLLDTRGDFDYFIGSYEKQIEEMFNWIKLHSDLYPEYVEKM